MALASFWKNVFRPTHTKKLFFFLTLDIISVAAALVLSFLLRFDFSLTDPYYLRLLFRSIPFFIAIKVPWFFLFRLYSISWRFVSLKDVYNVCKAVFVSSSVVMTIVYVLHSSYFFGFPRSVFFSDAVMTLVFLSCTRIAKRVALEVVRGTYRQNGKRTVIVGAGNTGEMILRDMQKSSGKEYAVAAFLDDDLNRVGTYLHGVKVSGQIEQLPAVVRATGATAVVIAIPSLGHARLRVLYTTAKQAGVAEIKIVPRMYDTHHPEFRVRELEDIKIEDLIGRQSVTTNVQEIGSVMEQKTVLVTGAGGSIGFELVQQVAALNPHQLLLFDIDETELHRAETVLRRTMPSMIGRIRFLVGDVRDEERVHRIFQTFKPDIVFHAAAYKHVPMMEYNAEEAVKVNILGTYTVARTAARCGTDRFIMISTDKAVKPTSVMGATKRIAEYVCRACVAHGPTEYISVRFGNVLGSRGSVLPMFLDQISRGEPLTVTHKDMRRYFMTIPEAVSLVLQASVIGRGGDVMVLDMGEPVKIIELAEELLRLHGLEPYRDAAIDIVGLRPGEKLFEEVLTAEEGTIATRHEKIFIARTTEQHTGDQIEQMIEQFRTLLTHGDLEGKEIRSALRQHVRWYEAPQVYSVEHVVEQHVQPPVAIHLDRSG